MCDRMVLLARFDHRRWVSCCEHGYSHLTWDSVSIRLPLSTLESVEKALQECAQVARHYRIAGTDEVCVVLDEYDLYQVWIGGIGLCLASEDFQQLCSLLKHAAAHPMAHSSRRAVTPPRVEAPIRTTYHLFSVN
jgi:hypothetical protein